MRKWKLLCGLIQMMSRAERYEHRLISLRDEVQRELDNFGDHWMTRTIRPKTPYPSFDITGSAASVGVVVQGKLVTEEDFTLRTVELYLRTFPGCPIFVSTWKNEPAAAIESLKKAGAIVLLNELPEHPAPCHLNYQIQSTRAGVRAVAEAGCRYALKTRTDTRMYAANVADFLAGLVERFPVTPGYGAMGRLVVLDYATRMFMPQHPSDMMVFGYTEDMNNYWDPPCCDYPRSAERPMHKSYAAFVTSLVPEIYLCRHYLRRIGYPFEPNVNSWWQSLADLFVVVDRTALEHFWPKYQYTSEHRSTLDDQLRNEALCSFRDWLGIMNFRKTPYFEVKDLLAQRPNERLAVAV